MAHSADRRPYGLRLVAALAIVLLAGRAPLTASSAGLSGQAAAHCWRATTLYDGALGTLPDAQGFDFTDAPSGSTQPQINGGLTTLDTTALMGIYAGYRAKATAALALDRAAGYQVLFTVQVVTETHVSNDRAGFSVIVLSADKRGIELGFWTNRIWAQGGPSFTQAEGVTVTTTGLVTYTLDITNTSYALAADGAPIVNGPLRDYSSFGYPYTTPNFLFLGDDTTSAQASMQLALVKASVPAAACVYLPLLAR